jgi:hypothetical protein
MKTLKFLLLASAALAVTLVGCDKYDDTELRNQITSLENTVKLLDTQIKAGALISSVTAIEGGWRVSFTGSATPIDILNGKNGTNGTNGEKGEKGDNGKDGDSFFRSVVDNKDGTITITLADGTEYIFERASSAVRFEIMAGGKFIINSSTTTVKVRFVVNPSTAWIPTTDDGGLDKWSLNEVSRISTRAPGYVKPSTAFTLDAIAPSANGKGEYEATLRRASGTSYSYDYTLALVLNTGAEADPDPVLVSSAAFVLGPKVDNQVIVTPPPAPTPVITITRHPQGPTQSLSESEDYPLSCAATITDASPSALSYTWYAYPSEGSPSDAVAFDSGQNVTINYNKSIPFLQGRDARRHWVYCVVSAPGAASKTSDPARIWYAMN